ncbi:hypothetical protein PLICRDRAFT_173980 [Plicaturopsis crispa FD-325 SS-3]|nr:hypothetical protein PLICRDRAFT_173980 [Plicaturopsis crispa FD-325 SS-3]
MSTFSAAKLVSSIVKLKGQEEWFYWKDEVEMAMRGVDHAFWEITSGKLSPPPDATALDAYNRKNEEAFVVIWNAIDSRSIRHEILKGVRDGQTAWAKLCAEFEKDVRSQRFAIRRRFNNPVHDPSKPISEYINSIVQASDELAAIGHGPSASEVTDMIIMHLHPSWSVAQTALTTRESEPKLIDVKSLLIEQERLHESRGSGAQWGQGQGTSYSRLGLGLGQWLLVGQSPLRARLLALRQGRSHRRQVHLRHAVVAS